MKSADLKTSIKAKIDSKTKPLGALGRLEDVALQIALIQKTNSPKLTNPELIVFAGDHGITEENVSPYPAEVTAQMVANFANGGAAINVFCKQNNIQLSVADIGVKSDIKALGDKIEHLKVKEGTQNILNNPAMSMAECQQAMDNGKKLVQKAADRGSNVIGFGEMGIGNTSSASLLMHRYTGYSLKISTGKGTGIDDEGYEHKLKVLIAASAQYPDNLSPLEILATFGGLEIAAMTGAYLEAYEKGMVILVDGFIASSALLAALAINKDILDNCIFCHCSEELGHSQLLHYLKVEPILDLGLRLGEGTGCAVAFPLVQSAVNFLNEMASFESANVSNKD